MRKHTSWICVALASVVTTPAAWGAHVEGFGTIATNFDSIDAEYEDPELLDAGNSVRLGVSELGPGGDKLLAYSGGAVAGRLRARSFIGGPVPAAFDHLSSSVDLSMEFHDELAPQNLNGAVRYLRVDVELLGFMTLVNNAAGNGTHANFTINMEDVESSVNKALFGVQFSWFEDQFLIVPFIPQAGSGEPRFAPYPDEEPRFTFVPHTGHYSFATRGHLDVPLDEDEEEGPVGLLFGEPFRLRAFASVGSDCGTEPPSNSCLAVTDFATALISNARFVDGNGDAVAGPSLTSESGYDYVVPEPDGFVMGTIALGSLAAANHRRHRAARALLRAAR